LWTAGKAVVTIIMVTKQGICW